MRGRSSMESRVSSQETARLVELDALRGVAITAVVGLHTSWIYLQGTLAGSVERAVLAAVQIACGIGVPLFLTLSAAGLATRHGSPFGSFACYTGFLGDRVRRLVPAYVAWSLLSLMLSRPEVLARPGRVLDVLVNGSADVQFYFVPLIFQLYILWPLIRSLDARIPGDRGTAMFLIVAGAVINIAVWLLLGRYMLASNVWTQLPMWIAYPALGLGLGRLGLLRSHPPVPLRAVAVAGGILILAFAASIGRFLREGVDAISAFDMAVALMIFQPVALVFVIAAIVFLALCATRVGNGAVADGAALLGRHSYGIFLCHLLILHVIVQHVLPAREAVSGSGLVVCCLVAWAACLCASVALVAAVTRIRWIAPLVTNVR